jgi:DUF438 domain-containing protein
MMSEFINNREHVMENKSERQEMLKEIIKELHAGKDVAEVKAKFEEAVGDVTVAEISQLEQALMQEEAIPVSEVQRLCSVHAEVFKGSIEEIHRSEKPEDEPGHPIHTWKMENKEIDRLVNFKLQLHKERFEKEDSDENRFKLIEDLNLLWDVDKHYSRKENLLFPYLEKYGIFGPTKVMWGVDDAIRFVIKDAKRALTSYAGYKNEVIELLDQVIKEVSEMIFKEEEILFPMALETLTEDEWVKIAAESEAIGFCLTAPEGVWKPKRHPLAVETEEEAEEAGFDGYIRFETGIVSLKQLETLLNHMPVDLTFIDENDVVRYFSHGKERIFARTKAVIGRTVQNCHPPQSVHVVEKLLQDFKSGVKDVEDFWINMGDKFIYIRYFAVRDEAGKYMGTLEFTQNVSEIRALEGEKRILS